MALRLNIAHCSAGGFPSLFLRILCQGISIRISAGHAADVSFEIRATRALKGTREGLINIGAVTPNGPIEVITVPTIDAKLPVSG